MNLFSRAGLANLLIGKSIAEALLVTTVAAGFYLSTTNPSLRGWLDQADAQTISGWAVDDERSDPARAKSSFSSTINSSNNARPLSFVRTSVRQRRAADDWHGFVFKTPSLPPGEHEATRLSTPSRRLAGEEDAADNRKALALHSPIDAGSMNESPSLTDISSEPQAVALSDRTLAIWEIASVASSVVIAEWMLASAAGFSKAVIAVPVIFGFLVDVRVAPRPARKLARRRLPFRHFSSGVVSSGGAGPAGGRRLPVDGVDDRLVH